ncbi:hypothetical protein GF352_03865 [archaeon]|nr:hypothetical protein [archaeon]
MKKKVMAGSVLALLVTMGIAMAGDGNAPFRITVEVDTTIFIPTLCEDGGSVPNTLEFNPGISTLDDPEAVAIDTCATGSIGDWNVTMAGNVPLDLSFTLSNLSPIGINITISNSSPATYTDGDEIQITNQSDDIPLWAQDLTDGSTLNIWQRVAANTSALGGDTFENSIIVTSAYTP